MANKILVTGASGVLGSAVVRACRASGLAVRQGVRDLKKASADGEAVRLDYTRPETIAPALAGVSGLVLIAPPLDPAAPAQLAPVISAAKLAGIEHVVFISAFGVNHNEQAPLRVAERQVMNSGLPYTILRPNFFMENFSAGFLAGGIRGQSAIHLAAGEGKTSFISVADIAAVAVAAIQNNLAGRELDLTGPAALDHSEAARIISEAAGRTIVYHSITEDEMTAGARSLGMPEPAIAYLAALYSAVRQGFAAGVTDEVENITGRKPVTFAEFARNAASAWAPNPPAQPGG